MSVLDLFVHFCDAGHGAQVLIHATQISLKCIPSTWLGQRGMSVRHMQSVGLLGTLVNDNICHLLNYFLN